METSQPFLGIVSGGRRRDHAAVAERTDRIASGLNKLGVKPGDSVCMLMRNDIAFIEAAYAAMRLGAYGVPINWHFKPEEINYVLTNAPRDGSWELFFLSFDGGEPPGVSPELEVPGLHLYNAPWLPDLSRQHPGYPHSRRRWA